MKAPAVIVIDFETFAIQSRPEYPPKPVGVSIKWPKDRKPVYYAWGHPTANNCSHKDACRKLKEAWTSGLPLLFHNAKFDVDVAETHMGVGKIRWELVHDTMYLLFLNDPHAMSLALKPSAERLLGMPPDERDVVAEWLVANQPVEGVKITAGNGENGFGKYIAYAPGDIVGKYANGDVVRTLKLFDKVYIDVFAHGMGEAYDRERRLMPIFLENERQGLRVDTTALERDIPLYHKARETAERWLEKRLGVKDMNFDADKEVGEALDAAGIVTDWVLTKKGQKSVAKKNMTVDKFNDKRVFYALGYRNRLTTCLGMFMEPWLHKADANGGYINPNWNQVRQMKSGDDTKGTRTGRPSCDDPNLLNVSKSFEDRGDGYTHPKFLKTLELPLVRRYALPDKGCEWIHRDYNQQELRILAHFEDGAILEAYRNDPSLDIHSFVQSEIKRLMHRDLDRVSVKTMNFGKLYGQGLGSLAEKLGVTVDEVKSIRDSQNKALPGLKTLEDDIKKLSKGGDPIVTWGGRVYFVEPPKFVEKFGREMSFEYKLLNYLVQGSAADITKEAILRYDAIKKKEGRFLVTVYDEINICAPKKAVKQEMKLLRDIMESVELDVPMKTDGKTGSSWGNLTTYKDAA